MILGLLAYRLYQVWWILNWGVLSGEDVSNQTVTFTSGQIFFLEHIAPFMILGGSSSLLPAILETKSDSVFYAALSSLCIFVWLILTHKLPPDQTHFQSLGSFFVTTLTAIALGLLIKKIKKSL